MTEVHEQISSSPVTDPTLASQRAELGRLGELETLRVGGEYTVEPGASLYPMEDIGMASQSPDGTKFTVAAEFGIPVGLDEKQHPNRFKFFAVVSVTSPQGEHAFTVLGLFPGENGAETTAHQSNEWLYKGQQNSLAIGRGHTGDTVDAVKLWGEGGTYGGSVSRRHVELNLADDGKLVVKTHGANGTWGEMGKLNGAEATDGRSNSQAASEQSKEQLTPTTELRFEPVEKDPVFKKISDPFTEALDKIYQEQAQTLARLTVELTNARPGGWDAESKVRSKIDDVRKKIAVEQQPIRDKYESAVKPYLEARLTLFKKDTLPGYAHDGQARYDHASGTVKSSASKVISRQNPNLTRQGNATYSSETPRLGQLLPPARNSKTPDWALSHAAGTKKNEETGVFTTSSLHVVDLAAAMLAGNFKGSDQPIVIRKAGEDAKYTLANGLQDKVPLYEVVLGNHRIAAERLIKGNDETLHGVEVRGQ